MEHFVTHIKLIAMDNRKVLLNESFCEFYVKLIAAGINRVALITVYDHAQVEPRINRGVIFQFQTRVKMQESRINRVAFCGSQQCYKDNKRFKTRLKPLCCLL